MGARTIPILPCTSIDATIAFYEALGFAVTYRQERPNTFAAVVRDDIELQFFVLKALAPDANYSTCYVLVDDVDALYASFADGLRAALGKVPGRGYPADRAPARHGVRRPPVRRRGSGREPRPDRPADRGRGPRSRRTRPGAWSGRSRRP